MALEVPVIVRRVWIYYIQTFTDNYSNNPNSKNNAKSKYTETDLRLNVWNLHMTLEDHMDIRVSQT